MEKTNEMVEKIGFVLADIEREYTATPFVSAVCAAYVLYIAHKTPDETELKGILTANKVSSSLARTITDRIGDHWEKYRPMLTSFSESDLADFFAVGVNGERLFNGKASPVSSSLPIVDLVLKVLDLHQGDAVCDLGCAAGDFIRRAYFATFTDADDNVLTGIEINTEAAAIAEIRMQCDDARVAIENASMFDGRFSKGSFDKVLCDAPLCMRGLPEQPGVREFLYEAFPDFPELSGSMTGDWLFAARAVAALRKGGKAAVVLSPSAMFDVRSAAFRRYFIQRNLIEAVIELPSRLFAHTSIPTYLVVFSAGNESVKMIRAGELCYSNRKNNVIGKGHVDIVAACLGLTATCDPKGLDRYRVIVGKNALLDGDCDLSVRRYFADPKAEVLGESVRLGELVEISKRGAFVPSDELNKLICDEDTDYLYVASGDINDGILSAKLQNLVELPSKYRPYCAKNGDIVITRVMASGAEFKVAVIDVPEGKMVLPNGNLLVFTVDCEKSDPYFIKACLDHTYAQRFMENNTVGVANRTLSYRSLEKLPIPALPLERQREIGRQCHEKIRHVVELRSRLAAAKSDLLNVLGANAADCFAGKES